MKATSLVKELIELIAKHGDYEVENVTVPVDWIFGPSETPKAKKPNKFPGKKIDPSIYDDSGGVPF